MARELREIDVSGMPDLLRLAEEVGASGEVLVLKRAHQDLAVLMPVAQPRRAKTRRPKSEEDLEAFRSSAGSWADVDTDSFVEVIYEGRKSSRPPVDL